jgi:hypothetical protein
MKRSQRGFLSLVRQNERGQAAIEFALTLILLLAFTLFFVQLSLMMAWGNYVQYATFMSARALLAAGPDQKDQKTRAGEVLAGMVKRSAALPGMDRFPSIARGQGSGGDSGIPGAEIGGIGAFEKGNRNSSWQEGVRYTFKSRLFFLPLGKLSGDREGKLNTIELTSESYLLREPSADECMADLEKRNADKAVFDNGC